MSQAQQMNMAGMGGPVGGGGGPAQQMNPGTPSNSGSNSGDMVKKLNTYIYDYFLRNQHYEAARTMINEQLPLETQNKQSPNQRQNQQPNGVDDLDAEMKESQGIQKRPDDLPAPALQINEGPFLLDWWFQFWDIFNARRHVTGKNATLNYIGQQRNLQKQRGQMMGQMAQQNMNNMSQMNMMGMNNGMTPENLKKAAMQNSANNMNPQQMAQLQRQMQARGQPMMQGGNQMERQGSQMDMSGPRSNSPASGDGPSSPKRQRIDGNMQQMGQRPGQPGQMQGNQVGLNPQTPSLDPAAIARTQALFQERGLDPTSINPEQFQKLSEQPLTNQQKSVEVYSASIQAQMKQAMASNMNKGMQPNPAAMGPAGAQGSPMSQAGMDGGMGEMYANGMRQGQMPPGGAAAAAAGAQGANNGNHALQDYQMQLMLLEQQNKKRLLMARQEQDSMAHVGAPGQNGQFAPNMSPQGSRNGPSPQPGDMARGTPGKGNAGMSPGNMAGRGSPTPGFDPNQGIPPQMRNQMVMGPNGQPMRQPQTSHPQFNGQMSQQQMEMFNRQQGMMPNGTFQSGGPQMPPNGMMPGQQPGQAPPPNMTPRQGAMPPPPAPQAGVANGTGPSSPSQPAAPPTPSQTNKPKPGGKKDTKANKKGAATKKGSAPTPASESEQPPTPTPATPITPMNANSFNKNQQMTNGVSQPPPQQNQPQQNPNAMQQPPQPDMGAPFGSIDNGFDIGGIGGMDFLNPSDGPDVLDNFDFDSFLNTGDDGGGLGFDANFAFGDGGLEAGGEGGMQ